MSKLPSFSKKLEEYTGQIKRNNQRFLPFVATTIAALEKSNLSREEIKEFTDFFRVVAENFPKTSNLLREYESLNPNFVFTAIYPMLGGRLQKKISNAYVSLFLLSNEPGKSPLSVDQASKILRIIKMDPSFFESEKATIRKALEDMFFEYPYLIIFKDGASQDEFLSATAIEKFINTIVPDDAHLEEKVELLMDLNLNEHVKSVMDKFLELTQFESGQPARAPRLTLSASVCILISKEKEFIEQLEDKSSIREISINIANWYSQDSEPTNKLVYANAMQCLKEVEGNEAATVLESQIRQFVAEAPIDVYKRMKREKVEGLAKRFPGEFRNASLRDLEILNLGINGLPLEERPSLVNSLIDKSRTVSEPEQRRPYFDWIVKLEAAKDPSLVDQFHIELMSLKASSPQLVNEYAKKKKLFNASQKAELQR